MRLEAVMDAVKAIDAVVRPLSLNEGAVALALALGRALRRGRLPLRVVEPITQIGDGRDEMVSLGRFAILAMRGKRSD